MLLNVSHELLLDYFILENNIRNNNFVMLRQPGKTKLL